MSQTPDPLREAAPAFDDPEAKRARAGVAAALFGGIGPGGMEPGGKEPGGIPTPTRVGRYELVGRLGAGGMGVVHRAHDPELDRAVAVKLLRPEVSADGKARARMLREARSLAKLSHPNVITVYDVGTVDGEDGQVFVAMELVAGKDLRRWLADRRGSTDASAWMEVLERFLAAGRGLEAAHEAGLIHRDFKPENVLVGDDGRVRVLDFGLARASASPSGAPSLAELGAGQAATGDLDALTGDLARMPTIEHRSGPVDGSLTETGAVLGTPLYMAPELYAGHGADAASDQFAYCASLWEGIYGRKPYGADNLIRHVEAVRAGALVEPPSDSPVPIELHRIVRRGLEPDPRKRYPDMHALLHELELLVRQASSGATMIVPEPRGSSARWLLVGALVVVAVGGLIGLELGLFGAGQGEVALAPALSDSAAPEAEPEPPPSPDPGVGTTSSSLVLEPAITTTSTSESSESGPPGESGETGESGEPSTTSEAAPPSEPSEPSGKGWCHLHEDSYTLLARTSRRRASFEDKGNCYVCRVESRRSRTQNFSPRDCAGYSLCGSAAAEACR